MTKAQKQKYIKKVFSGTEVGVLIEEFNREVKIIGEQYGDLKKDTKEIKKELGEFKGEMYGFRDEIYDFRDEMYGFRDEMYGFRSEMYDFRDETRENFKLITECLSRIEDDFFDLRKRVDRLDKAKISLKDFDWLKNKVLDIEKKLEDYRKQQTAFAAKL
ncbi:MAG: hypothetical protein WC831_00815 [Parcubacteria group bacterium]|jgi:uncharacterized coiled-coil DUF342 family protein